MKTFHCLGLFLITALLAACANTPSPSPVPTQLPPTAIATDTPLPVTPAQSPTETPASTPTSTSLVPNFDHIVVLIFENKEFGTVIGNPQMPVFNKLANDYTLLTQFYAVTHPSLPNYLSLIGGDTFGITSDCTDCFVNAPSLPDVLEAGGRTWKTYQEDMPSPCYVGSTKPYVQKHNPFIYFDPIRLDAARCERSVVPLTALQTDLAAGSLPNFAFITPNICNSGHDCSLDVSDAWLANELQQIIPALDRQGSNYLVVLTWDEGQGSHSCCGLPPEAGGRIAVVLVSPKVKNNFQDATPYTHYSLLKTISAAWGLPYVGHAADDSNVLITAPWK